MSNTQKAKIMSQDAFQEAVKPLIEQAVAAGYAEGFQAGYEKGHADALNPAPESKLVLP